MTFWPPSIGRSDMQTLNGVERQLLTLVSKRVNVEIPSAEMDLIEMGIIDSMMLVDLLLQIEKEFSVRILLEELEIDDLRSVARLAQVIVREKGK